MLKELRIRALFSPSDGSREVGASWHIYPARGIQVLHVLSASMAKNSFEYVLLIVVPSLLARLR